MSSEGAIPIPVLREALVAWGLEGANVSPLSPGATADVFLIETGTSRYVAKFAYQSRSEFVPGLLAAELLAATTQLVVAVPLRTNDGELVRMSEWPPRNWQPLAVMPFLRGSQVDASSAGSSATLGIVCGEVHRALLDVDPSMLDIEPDRASYLQYLLEPWGGLPEYRWLHDLNRQLVGQVKEVTSSAGVRWGPQVFDGPDILLDGLNIGLIDFGNVQWGPLIHVVANRSLTVSMTEAPLVRSFIKAVETSLPLTEEEIAALGVLRRANAAVYAKYKAWKLQTGSQRGASIEQSRMDLDRLAEFLTGTDLGLQEPE